MHSTPSISGKSVVNVVKLGLQRAMHSTPSISGKSVFDAVKLWNALGMARWLSNYAQSALGNARRRQTVFVMRYAHYAVSVPEKCVRHSVRL